MTIIQNKRLLNYAMSKIDNYILNWDPRFKIYEYSDFEKIEHVWCLLLITSTKKFIVTDVHDASSLSQLREVNKEEFIKALKEFEDTNYKIYYKQLEQRLVGYLLDFFEYYVEMPDKIITDSEDNIELYKQIKKQKLKL
jgi:hypothetical protein